MRPEAYGDLRIWLCLAVTGVVFTRLLVVGFSEVLPGDLGIDPRPGMAKVLDGVLDYRAQ